jgi:hypothetical protein
MFDSAGPNAEMEFEEEKIADEGVRSMVRPQPMEAVDA